MSKAAVSPATGFQKRLGLFDCAMLVAGSMIGSGIFIVSADIARSTGAAGWLLLVWVVSGLMTVLGALAYAELAAMMPHAGGQYVYLREAFFPWAGFLYGWTAFTVIQTGTIAAVGVAFAKFVGVFAPALGTGPEAVLGRLTLPGLTLTFTGGQLVGATLIVALTAWNTRGITEGKWVQNVFTVAKILGLTLLIVAGLVAAADGSVARANFSGDWLPGVGTLAAWAIAGGALVGALFSSDAWNNVTFAAGEVRQPQHSLPRALLLGTGSVVVLYLLANVAYLVSLPLRADAEVRPLLLRSAAGEPLTPTQRQQIDRLTPAQRGIEWARDDRVGTALMEQVAPGTGVAIMAIAIMLSTFGCLNGLILAGGRLFYAMAVDGLFFRPAGQLNARGVPAASLWAQALWASLLLFTGTYSDLLDYVIFAALLFYALTVIGLFVLRQRRPDAARPYRAVGYPLLPAAYILLCSVVMADLLWVKPMYTWPGLLVVALGVPVYFAWKALGSTTR